MRRTLKTLEFFAKPHVRLLRKADKPDESESTVTPGSEPAQTNNDIDKEEKHMSEMVDKVEETAGSITMVEVAPAMKEFVDGEWDKFWQSLPAPARVSDELVRTHWWKENSELLTKKIASVNNR